jgi:hypothetical protein
MRWILATVAIGALAGGWARRRRRRARQRALMRLCRAAGLGFAPVDPSPETAWLPFRTFGRPRSGTENVVWDPRRDDGVRVFDFWYEPSSDDGTGGRRTFTCATVPVETGCPPLRITPRDLLDDVAGVVGFAEVTVELEAFNERFRVEAEDARSAIAFLDQRMIEALLRLPPQVTVEVNEGVILLTAPLLPPERVLLLLQAASGLRRRVPRVLSSLYPPRPERGEHEDRWLQGRWSAEPIGADAEAPDGDPRPAR